MNVEVTRLLRSAEQVLDSECASKAAGLLLDPEVRLVDGAPTHEEILALLPTLRARQINSTRTGKRIYGLNQIVDRLAKLDPSTIVIGYGFISRKGAGNIYVSSGEGVQVLGAAIVDL